ncbi:hypothetical protein QBC40DRAFT_258923 [Triangularia verruculosa]|uniref:Uncharacterized protein n=1 Tax=Triangularia verruculosa TaxID=2587418 RepID=A0AAN6X9V2_9PEZI|nr:hypothetical protein QBC40DRAFT_258923 [Triangularia verruculosa]
MADSRGQVPSDSRQNAPPGPKSSELADVGSRQAFAFWAFHPDSMVYARQSQPAASGLITFVAVVRHMISFLSNVSREDFVNRLHTAQNPVFSAVLAFQPISKNAVDKDALISVIILWSQKHTVTAVFEEPIQYRPNRDSGWEFGMPSGGLPLLPAEDGLLSFDDGSNKSLSAHLFDEYQGHLANDITDHEIYRRFHGPAFLKVQVTIKAGHFKYHDDLYQLQLLGGSRPRFYRCIGVVRLRQNDSEGDLLRLFQPSGEAWYPYCEINKFKYPMTNNWDVDSPGEYLYIYVRVSKTTYDRKCETSSLGLDLQSTTDAAADALALLEVAFKGTSSRPLRSNAHPQEIQPPLPPSESPPFVPQIPPVVPMNLSLSTPVVPGGQSTGNQQHGTKRGLGASAQESQPVPKKTRPVLPTTRQPSGQCRAALVLDSDTTNTCRSIALGTPCGNGVESCPHNSGAGTST